MTHDSLYKQYIQNLFGQYTIPLFGVVYSTIIIFAVVIFLSINNKNVKIKPKIIYKTPVFV